MNAQQIELKKELLEMLRKQGAFWSYDPNKLDLLSDEIIMEKGLIHTELEDMDLLFSVYPKKELKRIWRERLVSHPDRYGILNLILAAKVFRVKNVLSYLKRYGKH